MTAQIVVPDLARGGLATQGSTVNDWFLLDQS
jgi:hypothetical protein